jgi:uncharacterized YigZ family protein
MPRPERYIVPAAPARAEITIERSRFIASLERVQSPEEAREVVARISVGFADATHNCWAYNAGPPGDTAQVGMSDDGEPHGTAGRPMLNALLHSQCGEVCVVVTRYFGGVKLGKGGLVRAYTQAVQAVLEAVELTERIEYAHLSVRLDYGFHEPLKRLYPHYEAEVLSEEFSDGVRHKLRVPEERERALRRAISENTSGRAVVQKETT